MSIRINKDSCIVCGLCAECCPGNLISIGRESAVLRYPADCWGCASCVKACPTDSISLLLGEDIGGDDSRMYVDEEGYIVHWHIDTPDGRRTTIDVDKRNANAY